MKKYASTVIFIVVTGIIILSITLVTEGSRRSMPVSLSTTSPTRVSKTYTLAEVANHSTQSNCWTTINGNVYDVTNWINQHPGGPQAILSLCGKDGTAMFESQHGGQVRPATELASFQIGILSK